jgi:predicted O-methyltransferase YrrM
MQGTPLNTALTASAVNLHEALTAAARARGCDVSEVRRLHMLDGVLRRVSASQWRDALVLRGSMLARMLCGPTWRPCQDVDFLGLWQAGFAESSARLREALGAPVEDGVELTLSSLNITEIFAETNSPGIRLSLPARVDGEDFLLQVDVGFGDPLDPPAQPLRYPTQVAALDESAPPEVLAVCPETSFAWKVHGLFEFELGHWRSKDLHDLYIWSAHATLRWPVVASAIRLAFESRGTPIEATFRLLSGYFGKSRGSRRAWQALHAERGGRDVPEDLDEVLSAVAETLRPLIAAITGRPDAPYVHPTPKVPSALLPGQARRRKNTVRRPDILRESWRPAQQPRQTDTEPKMPTSDDTTSAHELPKPHKRFSTIAHTHHDFYNPISAQTFEQILDLCASRGALPETLRALDLGAGAAEGLLRVLARYPQGRGVALDISPAACAQARGRVARAALGDRLEVVEGNALPHLRDWLEAGETFDLILCLGSSHSLGGYGMTLEQCKGLLAPNGLLLIGEGFWSRAPDANYLAFLGAQPGDYLSHAGNVEMAQRCGYVPLYSGVASAQEWDRYEGLYAWAIEDFVMQHPDDPDAAAFRARITTWRQAYLTWGRDTLGFGLYLLRPNHWPNALP